MSVRTVCILQATTNSSQWPCNPWMLTAGESHQAAVVSAYVDYRRDDAGGTQVVGWTHHCLWLWYIWLTSQTLWVWALYRSPQCHISGWCFSFLIVVKNVLFGAVDIVAGSGSKFHFLLCTVDTLYPQHFCWIWLYWLEVCRFQSLYEVGLGF